MSTKAGSKRHYRLRNWRDYNTALVRRGSLTLWVDRAALAGSAEGARPGRRGRPRQYSDAAIQCMLLVQTIYHLPLRATVGLLHSLVRLLGWPQPVAHWSTLSRRRATLAVALPVRPASGPLHWVVDATGLKVYGEGEWKVRQHGWTQHRRWLKVHLAMDAATHELRAVGVSTNHVSDGEMLPDLLAAERAPLAQVTGDGIYDEWRCWDAVAARPERPRAVFPPPRPRSGPKRARIKQHGNAHAPPLDRDDALRAIRRVGRAQWKRDVGYHCRSLIETAVSRLKTLFGGRLSAHGFDAQATEVFLRCVALNRMAQLGMPDSVAV